MSDPLLQQKGDKYRVSVDDGATWSPAIVQRHASGAMRYSTDGGGTWNAYKSRTEPSPEPPTAPPQTTAADPSGPSMIDRVGQGAADLARGIGRGASFDSMASLSAAATPEVGSGPIDRMASFMTGSPVDDTGISRMYRAGSATADLTAQNRREDAEAQTRSPNLTAAGMGVGMAPAAVASTAAGGGPAAMIGVPMAMGAMWRGGSADTARQFRERVTDPSAAMTDAAIGMLVPSAIQSGVNGYQLARGAASEVPATAAALKDQALESQIARWLQNKATGVAQSAGDVADNLRFGSYGARGSDVRAVANARGVQHIGDIARESEAMGLDKSNGLLSLSWKDALDNSDSVLNDTGKKIGEWLQSLSQPGNQGISDTKLAQMFDDYAAGLESGQYGKVDAARPLSKAIRDQAESLRTSALGPIVERTETLRGGAPAVQKAAGGMMNEMVAEPGAERSAQITRQYRQGKIDPLTMSPATPEPMTIADANKLKGVFNDQAFEGMRAMDSTRADANRAMGGITRDAIMSTVKESNPVAADALESLYRKYDIASSVKDAAQQRVLQESGNLQPSMYAVIGGAGAGPLGAIAGQISKIKGAATMANGARAVQRGAEGVQNALLPAMRGAPEPSFGPQLAPFPIQDPAAQAARLARAEQTSATVSPRLASALAAREPAVVGSFAHGVATSARDARDQVAGWLRAKRSVAAAQQETPDRALDSAMQTGALGPYAAQLQGLDREQRANVHTRLMTTDPEYRRRYTEMMRSGSAEDDEQ